MDLSYLFSFISLLSFKDYTRTQFLSSCTKNFSKLLACLLVKNTTRVNLVSKCLNVKLVLLEQTFSFLNTE